MESQGFRGCVRLERGIPCVNSTPHRARVTRKHVLACGSGVQARIVLLSFKRTVISMGTVHDSRAMCLLTALHPCLILRTGVFTAIRRFVTLILKILHVPSSTGKHTREGHVEIQKVYRSVTPREKGSSLSIEKSSIFLNYEKIMLPTENRQLYQNSLNRNIIRFYFLKKQILSEARSEMNMQELRVESADKKDSP